MHFISDFFAIIDATLNAFLSNTVGNVTREFKPVAMLLAEVYVVLFGYLMIVGLIQEPIFEGIRKMLKVCFITSLVITTGQYNAFISDWLWHSPDALASVITGNNQVVSSASFLDDLATEFFEKGKVFWDKGGLTKLPYTFMAIAIFGFGGALIAYGGP